MKRTPCSAAAMCASRQCVGSGSWTAAQHRLALLPGPATTTAACWHADALSLPTPLRRALRPMHHAAIPIVAHDPMARTLGGGGVRGTALVARVRTTVG